MTTQRFTNLGGPQVRRTLHLVDIENLLGGASFTVEEATRLATEYGPVAGLGPVDLTVVASSHYAACAAWFGWPRARRLLRSGQDGADLALVDVMESEDICARFDRVVIGSGDGIFALPCARMQAGGCQVTVVCRPGTLSRQLAFAVADIRYLADPRITPGVAALRSVA